MSTACALALPPAALISPATFSPGRRIEIEDADHAALLRQAPRDRRADAVGAAGQQDGASFSPRIVCSALTLSDRVVGAGPASIRVAS